MSAYITVTGDAARQQAEAADRCIAAGEAGPLTGIPMQIKDLLCTSGVPTTCASRMLAEYVPVYDATAVGRLREQGAVLLGKGNLDEFGMGVVHREFRLLSYKESPGTLRKCPGAAAGDPPPQ